MFKYLLVNFTKLHFLLIVYLSILCHTVLAVSDPVFSIQNELLSNDNKTDQVKREGKIQESMKIGNQNNNNNISLSDDKIVPPVKNVTVKKLLTTESYNSTANLSPWMLNIKDGALQRSGYVALGVMSIVVFFFVVRTVRLRHKKSKSRKYGIITSTVSDMEMEPLDKDDDEEEDTTLFDAQHKYSLQ